MQKSFDLHPITLIPFYTELVGQPFRYELSKYIYRPQTVFDTRELVQFDSEKLDLAGFEALIAGLAPSQELALHSRIERDDGKVLHIPMLDLAGPELDTRTIELLCEGFADFDIDRFVIYRSGRSFHAYGLGLLEHQALPHYFGRMLLLNLPDKPPVVDSRWVGHRLMGEFGSLRWTNNSGRYLGLPEKVGAYGSREKQNIDRFPY